MTRPCQQCFAHPANYVAVSRRRKVTGRDDHDLCRACWKRLMEAANVAEREWHQDKREATERYWARQAA